MTASALLVALFIGAAAGWLAGQLVQGTGFGLEKLYRHFSRQVRPPTAGGLNPDPA
jgi:hypothetical protein